MKKAESVARTCCALVLLFVVLFEPADSVACRADSPEMDKARVENSECTSLLMCHLVRAQARHTRRKQ